MYNIINCPIKDYIILCGIVRVANYSSRMISLLARWPSFKYNGKTEAAKIGSALCHLLQLSRHAVPAVNLPILVFPRDRP